MLTVIFAVYMIALSRIKAVNLRRWALIASYLACLLIPLFNFQFEHDYQVNDTIHSEAPFRFQAITSAPTSGINFIYTFICIVYLGGVAILFLHDIYGVGKILKLGIKGNTILYKGINLVVLKESKFSPFCFGGRIFMSEEEFDSLSDMVFIHEKSHITQKHFLDLMIGRLVIIQQWWNPLSWLMLRELQKVHEFQADNKVLEEGFDRIAYQYLLLNRASNRKLLNIGNGLGHTNLKQRLKMMNRKQSTHISYLAALFLLPAAVSGILIFSSPVISPVIASATEIKTFLKKDQPIKESNPNQEAVSMTPKSSSNPDILLNGEEIPYESINNINPSMIKKMEVNKNLSNHPSGLIIITLLDGVSIKDAMIKPSENK